MEEQSACCGPIYKNLPRSPVEKDRDPLPLSTADVRKRSRRRPYGPVQEKDPIVEVEKALDHEVHEMEHDIQADVDAVMKKYDRESNTRIWEGAPKIALQVLMSAFSIYCILMTLFSKALPERRLSLFLGFIIIIGYLVYPARKGAARVNHVPWYDWILMVLGAGSFFYFAINAFSIIQLATKLQPIHIIVGAIGILVLIELCRRCVGLPILVRGWALLLIYTFYNQLSWDPSFYKALKNIVYKLFYTTNGVIGTPIKRLLHLHRAVHHLRRLPGAHRHRQLLHQLGQRRLPAGPPAAPPRWRSSPPPCAAWCPAPPWATP